MSMWMSNTAAVAVLIPVALAMTRPLAHEGYRRAVVLGIAYAATIGGVGSAIGTPANQLAIRFLDEFTGPRDHLRRVVRVRPAARGALRSRSTGSTCGGSMVSGARGPSSPAARAAAIEQRGPRADAP